jgi:hypothetical protein
LINHVGLLLEHLSAGIHLGQMWPNLFREVFPAQALQEERPVPGLIEAGQAPLRWCGLIVNANNVGLRELLPANIIF